MQVLNLTSEQVASLPAPEREQISQLVSFFSFVLSSRKVRLHTDCSTIAQTVRDAASVIDSSGVLH